MFLSHLLHRYRRAVAQHLRYSVHDFIRIISHADDGVGAYLLGDVILSMPFGANATRRSSDDSFAKHSRLVALQAGVLRNMNDRSVYAGGTVTVSLTEEASVALGGQCTFGAVSSEYWYYPRSLYLRGDIFF